MVPAFLLAKKKYGRVLLPLIFISKIVRFFLPTFSLLKKK